MSNYRLRKENKRLKKKLRSARIRHRQEARLIRHNCDEKVDKWAHAFAVQEYDMMERGERNPVRWDLSARPIMAKMDALGGSIEELAFSTMIGHEMKSAGNDYILERVRDQMAWEFARYVYRKEITTITSREMPFGTCYSTRMLVVRLTSPDGKLIDDRWRKDNRTERPLTGR